MNRKGKVDYIRFCKAVRDEIKDVVGFLPNPGEHTMILTQAFYKNASIQEAAYEVLEDMGAPTEVLQKQLERVK